MALLEVNNVSKKLGDTLAVSDISFKQQAGEKLVIAGETGSGKSSLLKMIGGLIDPDKGKILFEGKSIIGPSEKLIAGSPGIVYMSQHFELWNNYTIEEVLNYDNKLSSKAAAKLYEICRINHLLKRKTNQLSGGERQRVVLARRLSNMPKLLLLDEPFSNLDLASKQLIKVVIDDACSTYNISCIMVLHDAYDMLSWASTILVMQKSELLQKGIPTEIYTKPVNEYCAGLFGMFCIYNNKIIRPENIVITNNKNFDVSGTILQIIYRGFDYILKVVVNEQVLQVHSKANTYRLNEVVYLKLII